MKLSLSIRKDLKKKINEYIDRLDWSGTGPKSERKEDATLVTEVDYFISELLHGAALEIGLNFFSEEKPVSLALPCMVVDPIDGTRELSKGVSECCVAVSIHDEMGGHWSWLYNPFSGFEIESDDLQLMLKSRALTGRLYGLVSRTEFEKGLYNENMGPDISISPRGSIAFKLGLLATGACDFVFSNSSKNIWDIDAGTLICKKRGISLYIDGKKADLNLERKIKGPLLWCREEYFSKINSSLIKSFSDIE